MNAYFQYFLVIGALLATKEYVSNMDEIIIPQTKDLGHISIPSALISIQGKEMCS